MFCFLLKIEKGVKLSLDLEQKKVGHWTSYGVYQVNLIHKRTKEANLSDLPCSIHDVTCCRAKIMEILLFFYVSQKPIALNSPVLD